MDFYLGMSFDTNKVSILGACTTNIPKLSLVYTASLTSNPHHFNFELIDTKRASANCCTDDDEAKANLC